MDIYTLAATVGGIFTIVTHPSIDIESCRTADKSKSFLVDFFSIVNKLAAFEFPSQNNYRSDIGGT